MLGYSNIEALKIASNIFVMTAKIYFTTEILKFTRHPVSILCTEDNIALNKSWEGKEKKQRNKQTKNRERERDSYWLLKKWI